MICLSYNLNTECYWRLARPWMQLQRIDISERRELLGLEGTQSPRIGAVAVLPTNETSHPASPYSFDESRHHGMKDRPTASTIKGNCHWHTPRSLRCFLTCASVEGQIGPLKKQCQFVAGRRRTIHSAAFQAVGSRAPHCRLRLGV